MILSAWCCHLYVHVHEYHSYHLLWLSVSWGSPIAPVLDNCFLMGGGWEGERGEVKATRCVEISDLKKWIFGMNI